MFPLFRCFRYSDPQCIQLPVYPFHHVDEELLHIVHGFCAFDVFLDGENHQNFGVLVPAVNVELAVTFQALVKILHGDV